MSWRPNQGRPRRSSPRHSALRLPRRSSPASSHAAPLPVSPVKATLGLMPLELRRVQDAIVAWVESVAPTLPIARLDRYVIDTRYSSIPGVSFEVALRLGTNLGAAFAP